MDNATIKLKVMQRLNKLASFDFDNLHDWQIVEAFNKSSVDWPRRQLHGTNLSKTGDEQTKRRIDDLQVLLTEYPLDMKKKDCHFASKEWPENYFEYKRVSFKGVSDCCEKSKFVTYLVEEANIDVLLNDKLRAPDFKWGQALITLANNVVKIWTNDEFNIEEATLHYYRQPRKVEWQGISNPHDGTVATVDVESEFKDDIVELLIDESVKILAGDMEYGSAHQIADKSVESNN
jgi:hypothetical protein